MAHTVVLIILDSLHFCLILELVFKSRLGVCLGCVWSLYQFGEKWHLNTIASSDMWTNYVSLFAYIFNFFQHILSFWLQVLHRFCRFTPKYFMFLSAFKCIFFLNLNFLIIHCYYAEIQLIFMDCVSVLDFTAL